MLSSLYELFWEYYAFMFTWVCWKDYILPFIAGWYVTQVIWILLDQKAGLKRLMKKTILIVLGSGGHTGEMMILLKDLDFKKYHHVYFLRANEDRNTEIKVRKLM